jgi:hypothetical protein
MCGKKNSVQQFPHVKRAFVEMSSPGLLFRAWDMAGFKDVTDFRMWFSGPGYGWPCDRFQDVVWDLPG